MQPNLFGEVESPGSAGSFVYVFEHTDTRQLKIGFTNNLKERQRQLQTASPGRLRLIASRCGSIEDERELHIACASDRTRANGEWFRPNIRTLFRLVRYFRETETQRIFLDWVSHPSHQKQAMVRGLADNDEERALLDLVYENQRNVHTAGAILKLIDGMFGIQRSDDDDIKDALKELHTLCQGQLLQILQQRINDPVEADPDGYQTALRLQQVFGGQGEISLGPIESTPIRLADGRTGILTGRWWSLNGRRMAQDCGAEWIP